MSMNRQPEVQLGGRVKVPQITTPHEVIRVVKQYLSSDGFNDRKITDTPTDALSFVNRKYVTANGTTAQRPAAPVQGQSYFDNSLAAGNGKPIWYGANGWVDATGTLV